MTAISDIIARRNFGQPRQLDGSRSMSLLEDGSDGRAGGAIRRFPTGVHEVVELRDGGKRYGGMRRREGGGSRQWRDL